MSVNKIGIKRYFNRTVVTGDGIIKRAQTTLSSFKVEEREGMRQKER
jgi:hypothetical protein